MPAAAPVVAIVDDDADVRAALADLLAVAGYRPAEFAGGAEFLDAALLEEPACVVTDVRMPRMSGLELLSVIKARAPELPVIVLTSMRDVDLPASAGVLGAEAFLAKPVSDTDLLDAIARAIAAARPPA